jgi:ubiquitin C-terminal hydrolase
MPSVWLTEHIKKLKEDAAAAAKAKANALAAAEKAKANALAVAAAATKEAAAKKAKAKANANALAVKEAAEKEKAKANANALAAEEEAALVENNENIMIQQIMKARKKIITNLPDADEETIGSMVEKLFDYHLRKPSNANIAELGTTFGIPPEQALNLLKYKGAKDLAVQYYFDNAPFTETPYKSLEAHVFSPTPAPNGNNVEPPAPKGKNGEPRAVSRNPHVGLYNCGMSCFINSTLQMLYHIPEFREMILGSTSTQIPFSSLRNIFTKIQTEENAAAAENRDANPQQIRDLLSYEFECILGEGEEAVKEEDYTPTGRPQQDVAEFLRRCIFQKILEQKRIKNQPELLKPYKDRARAGEEKKPTAELNAIMSSKNLKRYDLYIPDILSYIYHISTENRIGHYLKNSIQTGNYTFKMKNGITSEVEDLGMEGSLHKMKVGSTKEQPEFAKGLKWNASKDTQLEVQNLIDSNSVALDVKLRNDYLPQMLPKLGSNTNNPTEYVKPELLVKEDTTMLPKETRYVLLNLERFAKGEKMMNPIKINKRVKISNSYFECVGVVFHIGTTIGGGHYTYNWWNGTNWILFNDSLVSVREAADDSAFLPERFGVDSYVLLYSKINISDEEYAAYKIQADSEFDGLAGKKIRILPPDIASYKKEYAELEAGADKQRAVELVRKITRLESEVATLKKYGLDASIQEAEVVASKTELESIYKRKNKAFQTSVNAESFPYDKATFRQSGIKDGKRRVLEFLRNKFERTKNDATGRQLLTLLEDTNIRNSNLGKDITKATYKGQVEAALKALVPVPAPVPEVSKEKEPGKKTYDELEQELVDCEWNDYVTETNSGKQVHKSNTIVHDNQDQPSLLFKFAKKISSSGQVMKHGGFLKRIAQVLFEHDNKNGTTFIYELVKDDDTLRQYIMGKTGAKTPGFVREYTQTRYNSNKKRYNAKPKGGRRITHRKRKH